MIHFEDQSSAGSGAPAARTGIGSPDRTAPADGAAARRMRVALSAMQHRVRERFNANAAIAVFGLTLIGVTWIATLVHVQFEQQDRIDNALRHNTNLVKAFEGHTVRTLRGVDSLLLLLKQDYERPGARIGTPAYLEKGIFDKDLVLALTVADQRGKLLLGSGPARSEDPADTGDFKAHAQEDTGKPMVGKPVQDKQSLAWSLPVSRRINKSGGSFGGVVTAFVNPGFITGFYRQTDLGEHGVVGLVGLDGVSRVRQSGTGVDFSRDMSRSNLLMAQAASANGSFISPGRIEGIPRYLSYRTLADYPLVVEVGTAQEDVLAASATERRRYYWAAALVSTAVAVFAALLMAALTRQRRALLALADSETQFRATFNQAAIGIAHIAPDGSMLQVNQKLCDMLGYTRDELLALKSRQLEPPETREKYSAHRARLVAGEIATFSAERPLKRKDGSLMWTNRSVSLVRDAAGAPQYFISVVEDITERRASEHRFHATFEQAAVGLAHVAIEDRRHLLVNQTLCDMLGYSREELLALPAEKLLHPDDFEASRTLRNGLLGGAMDTTAAEVRYVCKDSRVIWVNRTTSVARDDDGRPLYLIRVTEDISERKETEQKFRATFDQGAVGVAHVAPDGRYLRANAFFCAMLGYTEAELLQMTFYQITHPEDIDAGKSMQRRIWSGELNTATFEKRYVHKNGSVVWANLSLAEVWGADHEAKYHIALVTDITTRKEQEQKILRLDRIRAVLSGINSLIVRVRDRDALFKEACKIAVEHGKFDVAWIGMLNEETLDVTPVASAGLDLAQLQAEPRTARPEPLHGQGVVGRAIRERRAVFDNDISSDLKIGGGSRRIVMELGYHSVIALPISVRDRVVGNLALYFRDRNFFNADEVRLLNELAGDISFALEYISQEEKLNHLAYHDVLTGLPNRQLFQDRLEQALLQARRSLSNVGVMFLDLDGFKIVNDTLGHVVGDRLLQIAARRLQECVREGDSIARFGGDEFVVMLSGLAAAQDAGLVAKKILDAFAAPFELEGNETYVTTSIGIASYPFDGDTVDALIKNADAAMYGAKAAGRNNYQFFVADMNNQASNKMQLGARLRRALERHEFVLHFQPKIDLPSGRIVGFEALLRWQPPDSELVSPAEFIPLLEETGLIVQAGEWVLRAACAQVAEWQAAGIAPVPIAINLSARQFQHAGLDALVRDVLRESGVEPRWIELEITESMLMQNPEAAIAVLENLKALGIRISVDDFGTGYSSLSYLKRFPLDALKVDRSFVSEIPDNSDDAAIARAIITMAHGLGLKVIAEGVETREQMAFLRTNRCDEGQGYLFSPPLPAAECAIWLTGSRHSNQISLLGEEAAVPAVLLVDDDADCLALIRSLLAPDHYRILTAGDAAEALELLAGEEVSVVVSDENMPGMSGVELLSRVKATYPHIARIMMTGDADFNTASRAVNVAGVCKFYVKQRDDHLLRSEVRRAFWARRRADDGAGLPQEQGGLPTNVVAMPVRRKMN